MNGSPFLDDLSRIEIARRKFDERIHKGIAESSTARYHFDIRLENGKLRSVDVSETESFMGEVE